MHGSYGEQATISLKCDLDLHTNVRRINFIYLVPIHVSTVLNCKSMGSSPCNLRVSIRLFSLSCGFRRFLSQVVINVRLQF